jgi:hypothetical protein
LHNLSLAPFFLSGELKQNRGYAKNRKANKKNLAPFFLSGELKQNREAAKNAKQIKKT